MISSCRYRIWENDCCLKSTKVFLFYQNRLAIAKTRGSNSLLACLEVKITCFCWCQWASDNYLIVFCQVKPENVKKLQQLSAKPALTHGCKFASILLRVEQFSLHQLRLSLYKAHSLWYWGKKHSLLIMLNRTQPMTTAASVNDDNNDGEDDNKCDDNNDINEWDFRNVDCWCDLGK